jgi:hypothetical protein
LIFFRFVGGILGEKLEIEAVKRCEMAENEKLNQRILE